MEDQGSRQRSSALQDPFPKPLQVTEHPLRWCLDKALKGEQSDYLTFEDTSKLPKTELAATFARHHERVLAGKVVESRRKLPPVINERALFTKAAPFTDLDDPYYHSPTNRVGNHYTPTSMLAAASLFEEFCEDNTHVANAKRTKKRPPGALDLTSSRSTERMSPTSSFTMLRMDKPVVMNSANNGTGSIPANRGSRGKKRCLPELTFERLLDRSWVEQRSKKIARIGEYEGASVKELADAICRYYYYIEKGISDKHVAQFRSEWVDNVLALVPEAFRDGYNEKFSKLIKFSLAEMHDEYSYAIKKSIMDYILQNPIERQRLNLDALSSLLEVPDTIAETRRDVYYRELMPSWPINVDIAREEIAWTLQTLSANALELNNVWLGASHAEQLLVQVSGEEFEQLRPMDPHQFRQMQLHSCETMKAALWTSWVPKSAEVFRRLPPIYINNDDVAYFRSIATLQSNQLRNLVLASVDAYQNLFESYPPTAEIDPQQDTILRSQKPLFIVRMDVEEGGKIVFTPSLSEVDDMIRDVLDTFIQSVSGIQQVAVDAETLHAGGCGNGPNHGMAQHTIPTTGLHEDSVVKGRKRILELMEGNAVAPRKLADLFQKYTILLNTDTAAFVENFVAQKPSLEDYAVAIGKHRSDAEAIRLLCTDDVATGVYYIQCASIKETLASAHEEVASKLLEEVRMSLHHSNIRLSETYLDMANQIGKVSHSGEDVLQLKKYIQKCTTDQEKIKEEMDGNKEKEDFLVNYRHPIPEDDFEISLQAYEWPQKMVEIMKEATTKANMEHREFEQELKKRRKEFSELLEEYQEEVNSFEQRSELQKRDQITQQVTELMDKLNAAATEGDEINVQEKLFGWPTTKYGMIQKMITKLDPYFTLWTTCSSFYDNFATWMNGPFIKLDPEAVETEVTESFRKIYKLIKSFSGATGAPVLEAPLSVGKEVEAKIKGFQTHLSLIQAICNKGLRDRHWEAMGEVVGFEIKRDEVTSLRRLLDNDISEHVQKITELSDTASREWSIEKALHKMLGDWEGLQFELGDWKETGTYILKGGPLDEAQTLLDDHIVKSQAMTASPFAKPFEDMIVPWERKLTRLQDIMDQWLKCQGKWLYLEPIFGSEEIMKQIPREGTAFREMDATWRKIMEKTKEEPTIMEVADFPGLLEELEQANAQLDIVEKGLNDFLDTKKKAFPRFFFLSNDEVLEILSEAKDPQNVQPFVKKCFEAIKELKFEENGEISGMMSVEGEKIPLAENINPAATGAVEKWLLEFEGVMKRTLHKMAGESLEAYAQNERSRWLLEWPGQLVLNISQVFWTKEVMEAISTKGSKGLAEYGDKCTDELNKIVNLVRGQLTSLERATCGALVVIDVHARDVTVQMAKDGVEDVRDFKWESQLRYNWDFNEQPPSGVHPQETIVVRMINAEALYGYEYLGNSGRLVITPLTDRCYRTLMGAIHMNLGGAPAGPAGTGKTETTKDLSKALAIQCVVFNCSDGLDYKAMGRFFKGLACSGAWACFDEFNRIELEVLSVVAQQVLTIQRAKAQKVKAFMFEGAEINLNPTCNAFITMNPGYAGRSELPDNLKALFRDVAMMVPDYAMISEIILYSFGYLEARSMAQKLVQTYRLCSEQLSSQDHYDYGMRAVISVLRAAGNLKRSNGEEKEDVLMLRAINDVNLPKFLDQDVPLFEGILSDLFPGVSLPPVDYDNLRNAVVENCKLSNLQPLDTFFTKIVQLYEMIVVRHGLMLVGQSFGMKTAASRILQAALTDLNKQGLNNEHKTKVFVLNPKSVTMGQLYGQEDPISKEWTDGILAVLFRNAARDTSPDRKWVLFDGPVDAIWIENMNTVLDDNKKLCLNSGEIIAMQGLMNMIFEVQDLAVASPATVSRCGMVYVQPSLLGWRPVMVSWMNTLPEGVTEGHRKMIMDMFDWLVPPTLRVATRQIPNPLPMQDINLVGSCMALMESLMDEFRDTPEVVSEMNENMQTVWVQSIFLFSLVWSIGANTNEVGRQRFDTVLRKLLVNDPPADVKPFIKAPPVKITQLFPEGRLVYDFTFEKARNKWVPWLDTVEPETIDPEAEYSTIIIPTMDTIRYTFLLDKLVTHSKHCLFVGPTGTGKTIYIKKHLQHGLPENMTNMMMNFSAQTSANMTQDIIDGKLDKRRKGVFGPPPGKKMIIFVDDLNMPQVEEYGAQPPIELLRQWMDHQGWYDRSEKVFRKLVDVQFVAAMGPPGGGRNSVTNRYLRHFSVVSVTAFDNANLTTIFSTLVDWWIKKYNYGQNVSRLSKPIVAGTLELYERAQNELLPTPTKSHYTYNLRDVSKVIQGITKAGGAVEDPGMMLRLWMHEILRVFYDRLVNNEDRSILCRALAEVLEKHCKEKIGRLLGLQDTSDDSVLQGARGLLFGDYMVPGADPKIYTEITDASKLESTVTEYLSDFNATSKKPMNLVLFKFALEHVSRICRIITSPGGHALLVGLGGSGRQSLTRLAAFMEEYDVFQIEISKVYGETEWHEDIKSVLKVAGEANKKIVFLFVDTQIKQESFVEDISNLINTYEVPNLLQNSDLATIFENIRPRAKQAGMDGTREQLYSFFLQCIRANLHIVLSFSPVGDAFRERLRKFPALVNCTTIDWFTQWPDDALQSVAKNFLSTITGVEKSVAQELPNMCVLFHESLHSLSARFLSEQRRHYYVTPTSYLELLLSYKTLLDSKQEEVMTVKKRYEIGLEKLANTEQSVEKMQEELIALQPQLVESTKETEAAMEVIAKETEEADKVKEVVSKEEAVASAEAAKVKAIKDECEADLAEAMPLLESALKALDTLTKNDITEVKGMKSPPSGVKIVLEAVCILKNIKPIRVKDANSGKMVDDFWEASKKMLMESDFLQSLRDFDKDNIPLKIVEKIRPYVNNPEFEPSKILQASKAAYGLCCWVRAMEAYDRVAKLVGPKKQKLGEAEQELEVVMSALRTKQAELQEVLDKLAALDADLQEKKAKKARLEAEVELCTVKLERAQKVISGLGGEKSRWTAAAESLGIQFTRLTGNVLLAAGQIAYLGAFTGAYRQDCLQSWVSSCQEKGIPCSEKFKLEAVLGDPVKIRDWNIGGLPKDDFSTENGVIVDQGRRWPLCIDPQGLANKWFRNLGKSANLMAIKLTDPNYLRTLENGIQFGKPILLENINETLDAALEPLLQKQLFKQGGSMCIKLGDSVIEYSENFKFYITTKLRNPHYAPELCTKVSLINFMTTPEGLEDQLLGIVVAKERPDLEEEKNKLIIQGAENKRKLKEIEDQILKVLSASEGNILDDEEAVSILQSSKALSDEISEKQKIADETETKIDEARAGYKPVAQHSSILYFCVTDMANIDPMYQYSLSWFVALFIRAIAESQQSDDLEIRLQLLNDFFTYLLFQNICRSLFEKDKLLFAFVLASKLQIDSGKMSPEELRFLLTGGVAMGEAPAPNPGEWISDKMWGEVCRASALSNEAWCGFYQHIADNTSAWRKIYDAQDPSKEQLPDPWQTKLDGFQRLIALRTLRPDKLVAAITAFVASSMGRRFVDPVPFAIEPSYNDSKKDTPLIFILSAGSDPMASLLKFADDRGSRVESVSLGQGQGPVAQKWIDEGMKEGFWVVLQNCHLAKSFLPTLELLCETQLKEASVHNNFRLWLTSYPSTIFPISILESGVKMTNEAPKGLRAGLLRTYMMDPISNNEFFDGCRKDGEFRKLLMGLALFHSIIQERKKFGPIGWNIPYEFNENDLRISVRQLQMFLDEYADIPYDTLSYTCGECNYGGKVTDGHDRHTLMTILTTYYTPEIHDKDYKFSPSGTYFVPEYTNYKGYLDYINSLPLITSPEVFGLHDNANITKDLKETNLFLESFMMTQSRDSSGGGKSMEETIGEVAASILEGLQDNFDTEAVQNKYPQDYFNSVNTVLVQELGRFNNLLSIIRNSLRDLQKAVKGLALMSSELDLVGKALFDGKIPALWLKKSFPSLKPLASYMKEVHDRIDFFQGWIDNGPPVVFWISGFFFTQAFLTGVKQNFARKFKIPIDHIDFDFEVKDREGDCDAAPEDGALCNGLFVEGCRWDYKNHVLGESEPKVLFTAMPAIWMVPTELSKFRDFQNYNCPLYKTPDRRGVLSTTGHSTNFVMDVRLPSHEDASHWTKRGVAMLTSLDY
ncbi:hypothetical protein BSKO_01114 [Bryopsis sp. KO-2023]|nr:hypothetical protein BSKO_01114 [Bryopsis sp. KO-2023]